MKTYQILVKQTGSKFEIDAYSIDDLKTKIDERLGGLFEMIDEFEILETEIKVISTSGRVLIVNELSTL